MLVTKQKSNIKVSVTGKDIPFFNKAHIFTLYNLATEEEKNTNWYLDAQMFAADLALKYGFTLEQSASMISAISPQTKWEKNLYFAQVAAEAFEAYNLGYITQLPKIHKFSEHSAKGYKVLFGEPYALGQKTESFAKNICGDTKEVTIDSLAISILLGFYTKAGSYKISNEAYKVAQKLYTEVADSLGIEPSHCQAVTWNVCRRLKKQYKGVFTLLDVASVVGKNNTPNAFYSFLMNNSDLPLL